MYLVNTVDPLKAKLRKYTKHQIFDKVILNFTRRILLYFFNIYKLNIHINKKVSRTTVTLHVLCDLFFFLINILFSFARRVIVICANEIIVRMNNLRRALKDDRCNLRR